MQVARSDCETSLTHLWLIASPEGGGHRHRFISPDAHLPTPNSGCIPVSFPHLALLTHTPPISHNLQEFSDNLKILGFRTSYKISFRLIFLFRPDHGQPRSGGRIPLVPCRPEPYKGDSHRIPVSSLRSIGFLSINSGPAGIQTLGSKGSVERFTESVVGRLLGPGEINFDTVLVSLLIQYLGADLRPIGKPPGKAWALWV